MPKYSFSLLLDLFVILISIYIERFHCIIFAYQCSHTGKFDMKKFAFLSSLLICQYVYPQNKISMQRQIDSLNSIRTEYVKRIEEINVLIKAIEDKKIINEIKIYKNIKYEVPAHSTIKIRDKDNSSGKILFEPQKGEIITLVDFNDVNDFWLVSYNNEAGYLNDVFIKGSSAITNFKKYLIEKRAQDAEENNRKFAELNRIEAQKRTEAQTIDEQKRDSIARQLVQSAKRVAEEEKNKEEQRKAYLIKKYGSATGKNIFAGRVWIGMKDAMAKESWGDPEVINRTVGSWGVREQWVYPDENYLYFENGVLTHWQN